MPPEGAAAASRTVLMLASGFPPDEQYILRTVKFAEYLPEFGWRPVVLTPRAKQRADRVLEGLKVERYRAIAIPALSRVMADLYRAVRGRQAVPVPSEDVAANLPVPGRSSRLLRQTLLWTETPDALAGWIPLAVGAAWRLIRRRGVEAIHASGPPFSVVLAGAILARLTRLPLVADFRDVWTMDASDPFGTLGGAFRAGASAARMRVLRRLERWSLGHSRATLFTSEAAIAGYRERYPEYADRFHLILNGADERDFEGVRPAFEEPTIAHVGTLHDYQFEQVAAFLAETGRLLGQGDLPPETRIAFVGPIGDTLRARIEGAARACGTSGRLLLVGALPRAGAIDWMRRSWLLLLFLGENRVLRLSKLSEYLAAGRPILGYGSVDSPTGAEVVARGGVLASRPEEPVAVRALVDRLRQRPAPSPACPFAHPHALSRRTEASALADLLARLTGRS